MRVSTMAAALITALTMLVFCPSVQAASPEIWQFAHPDSNVLIGIEWARAKSLPGGRVFSSELADAGAKAKHSGTGFEILDSVDRILVSTAGRGGFQANNTPMVIAIEGRLDLAKIRRLLPPGTALERFSGVDLYVPPKTKPNEPLLAVLNERMVLFGPRRDLAAVLDARSGAAAELSQRAAALSSQCELWVAATAPSEDIAPGSAASGNQFKDIEAIELGVSFAAGLGLRMDVTAKNEAAAQGFAGLVQIVSSMAAKDAQKQPAVAELARQLEVATEGRILRLRMNVPVEQLQKSIAEFRQKAAEAGAQGLGSLLGVPIPGGLPGALGSAPQAGPVSKAAQTPPPAPLPQEKQVIKIYGMESGPVEIPYGTPPKKKD